MASLLAQGIAGVLCSIYAVRQYSCFRDALKTSKFDKKMAKQILKLCIPMGFQYSLIYLSGSIMQWVINRFGTGVIGAFAATNQIENLIQQPFYCAGNGNCYIYRSECRSKGIRNVSGRGCILR